MSKGDRDVWPQWLGKRELNWFCKLLQVYYYKDWKEVRAIFSSAKELMKIVITNRLGANPQSWTKLWRVESIPRVAFLYSHVASLPLPGPDTAPLHQCNALNLLVPAHCEVVLTSPCGVPVCTLSSSCVISTGT